MDESTPALEQGLNSLGSVSTPSIPSAAPSDEWQRRHAGLQSSLTKALETTGWGRLDAIPKKGDVETWQQAAQLLPTLQSKFETTEAEKQAAITERDQALNAKAALELETRKTRLLADKAADLFPFLRYIPTVADEAAQLAEFETFRATLGQAGAGPTGARPSVPFQPASQPQAQAPTPTGNLYPLMLEALQKGNMSEYARLKAEWYAAVPQPE